MIYICIFDRGWTAIINDNLASNALMILALSLGLITGVVGGITALLLGSFSDLNGASENGIPLSSVILPMIVAGFVIGLFIGVLVSSIIDSAYATVFVCLAESPYALQVINKYFQCFSF